MHISVVVPTHQRPEGVRALLESLKDQDLGADPFEVHVVGNLSGDAGEKVVNEYRGLIPNIHWHCVGRKGVNAARNLGIKKSRAPIVLLLDDDCVISHRYFLAAVIEAHNTHPEITAIGGAYFTPPDASAIERTYNLISSRWLWRITENRADCVHLVGGNVSYKKKHLETKGILFNEEIIFGGAETDFHNRLYLKGCKFHFDERLSVEHRAHISYLAFFKKAFLQGMGAQIRWQSGIHVATRPQPKSKLFSPIGDQRLYQKAFDYVFNLGKDYVRFNSDKSVNRIKLIRSIFYIFLYRITSEVGHWIKRPKISAIKPSAKSEFEIGLPLDRFYVLPVHQSCKFKCSYCPKLNFTNTNLTGTIEHELSKAIRFGYKDILLPCNAFFDPEKQAKIKLIKERGLNPVVLVNGDSNASVKTADLDGFGANVGFHLLVAENSTYQSDLIGKLMERFPGLSATYMFDGSKSAAQSLRSLPQAIQSRLHLIVPSSGGLWHPEPSSNEIAVFIKKLIEKNSSGSKFTLRSVAGKWPIDRGPSTYREIYPYLEPIINHRVTNSESRVPDFSVIIPTFDNAKQLNQVIRSLANQTIDPTRFEVIVVDDGSTDGTESSLRELLKSNPVPFHFRYYYWERFTDKMLSFRAGLIRNVGVSFSRGKFLCFLDSDILVSPDYLADLEMKFASNDVIQARREMLKEEASQSGKIYSNFQAADFYKDEPYWEDFKANESWSQLWHYWKYTCTYSLSLRKSLFEKVGWFATDFFCYGFEDVDLGYRLHLAGARFHLNQNPVYHLYPERKTFNYHFDYKERQQALTLSARVFYRLRLDPIIFREFQYAIYQPLRGELKLSLIKLKWTLYPKLNEIRWSAYRLLSQSKWTTFRILNSTWWTTYRLVNSIRWFIYHLYCELSASLVSKWTKIKWLIWQLMIVPMMKPYFFLKYQWDKRIVPKESRLEEDQFNVDR